MLALFLFILAVITRIFTHIPNFTPIIAVALFGGIYLNKKYAIILPILVMALTDIIIGFHNTMLFTWGSLLLTTCLGFWLREQKSFLNIFLGSVASSVLFFIITNFGVWLAGDLYPQTLVGLIDCFMMAIPFFRGTFFSTIIYTALLFAVYELIAVRVKNTRLATVLLN